MKIVLKGTFIDEMKMKWVEWSESEAEWSEWDGDGVEWKMRWSEMNEMEMEWNGKWGGVKMEKEGEERDFFFGKCRVSGVPDFHSIFSV